MVPRMKTSAAVAVCALLFLSAAPARAEGPPPLLADDGEVLAVEGALTLAVVGNLREPVRAIDTPLGRTAPAKGATEDIVADIAAAQPDGLVLLGDAVRSGKKSEYKRLSRRAGALLSGAVKLVPVVGEHESMRDDRLQAWGEAFPGAGADIGLNRAASWYAFDVKTDGYTYRIVVLDSNRQAMGSRWGEQLTWLQDEALQGKYQGVIVFMHHALLDLAGAEPKMNRSGVPSELLDIVEDRAGMGKLRAVFSADGHVSEVLRPDGALGTLYVGAGGGGAPGEDLSRWADASEAGRSGDVSLDTLYDVAILKALDYWSDDHPVPPVVIDQAKGQNSFEGFRPLISARHMPTYGWFLLTLEGAELRVDFRHRLPDGTVEGRYALRFSEENGWIPASAQ